MAGVTVALTVQAKPGRHEEVLKGPGELKALAGNQGLRSRLLRPITWDNQGAITLATEFDSISSFGTQTEKIAQSPEYQKILQRARKNPDIAAASISNQLYTEIE